MKRRINPGITRTSCLLILTMTTALHAQQIPFDYFYGRIVGRQQFGVQLHDQKLGSLQSLGSYTFGVKDLLQMEFPHIVSLVPSRSSDKIHWNRPPLSGSLQLEHAWRLTINTLDWHDDKTLNPGERGYNAGEKEIRTFDGYLVWLSHGGVRYEDSRSIYTYLDGLSLPEGSWFVKTNFAGEVTRQKTYGNHFPSEPTIKFANNFLGGYQYDLCSELAAGVSSKLQLGLRAGFGQQSLRGTLVLQRYQVLLDTLPDWYSYTRRNADLIARSFQITPNATFHPTSGTWIDLSVGYAMEKLDTLSLEFTEYYGNDVAIAKSFVKYLTERTLDAHLFAGAVFGSDAISYYHILDNYSGYYADEFSSGTFVLEWRNSLSLNSINGWHEDYDSDMEVRQLKRHYDTADRGYAALLAGKYYLRPNVSGFIRFDLSRQVQSYDSKKFVHRQEYGFSIGLAAKSYYWQADASPEISWDNVSDIDYLLGPLLRNGHWSASLHLVTPTSEKYMESESGQLFNFFGGDFDTQWRVIATAAKGVGGSFQPAITVDWTTWRSDLSGWPLIQNNYRTVITPRIAWQIWNKVRVTAQLESKIHHTVKKGRFTGTTLHEYTSEWWSLDLFFDLIL